MIEKGTGEQTGKSRARRFASTNILYTQPIIFDCILLGTMLWQIGLLNIIAFMNMKPKAQATRALSRKFHGRQQQKINDVAAKVLNII